MISFDPASVEDAAEISALTRHVICTVNSKDYSTEEVELACDLFSLEYFSTRMTSRIFYKVTLDNEIIGQASFGDGKIHSLFVHPQFQGRGIGSKLLAKLELAAIEKKTTDIFLSSSITAKGFYEKFGYLLVRSESSPFGTTFLMEKQLVQNC